MRIATRETSRPIDMGKAVKAGEDLHAANNPIFNKELGQHILKNPLVAAGIVDKVRPGALSGPITAILGQHPAV